MAAPVEPPDPVVDPARIRGDIRPFFRPIDIGSMLGSFDLASFEDVCANAQDILDAVASQFVPCDGPWPPERVELFRRWVDGGSTVVRVGSTVACCLTGSSGSDGARNTTMRPWSASRLTTSCRMP